MASDVEAAACGGVGSASSTTQPPLSPKQYEAAVLRVIESPPVREADRLFSRSPLVM